MSNRQQNNIQCELYKNPCKLWLKETWCELEQQANPSFFLSWLWIGTWLEIFVDDFVIIEARKQNRTVGLGIFVQRSDKLFCVPFKNKLYLHRTGIPTRDQIWIEYNDFLLDADDEESIRSSMFECLAYGVNTRDAIVIGASDENKFKCINHLGLKRRKIWETNNYALNLDYLRANNQSVLEFLSRNARYQIQRSMRKYEEIGDITLEKACSISHAREMLEIAKPLHLARWNGENDRSGFGNDDFITFHERLIEKGIASGAVELYHIKAGDETLSIMYNFRHDNHIYFYLCAINYCHKSTQFKPGLVSHYLLINKALEEGINSYDFMGGHARYKETFSNTRGELSVIQYEHANSLLVLEQAFRDTKVWFWKKRKQVAYKWNQGEV